MRLLTRLGTEVVLLYIPHTLLSMACVRYVA